MKIFKRFSIMADRIVALARDIGGKLFCELAINRFDKKVQLDFMPQGFKLFTGCLNEPVLDLEFTYNKHGSFQTRDLSLSLAKLVRDQIAIHKELISGYLPTPIRLDDMYLSCINPSLAEKKGLSEGWHHDHCGHRLKMFICLLGDGSTPTLYIPGSHKRRYQMNFRQLLRILGFSDYSVKSSSVAMGLATGDVGIFDSNGTHRGGFTEESSERICLVLEFIAVEKSNYISKYCPCGPGGSKFESISMSREVKEVLQETGFLDEDLLKNDDQLFNYSISNL